MSSQDGKEAEKTGYIVTDLPYGEAAFRAAAFYREGRLDRLEVRRREEADRVGQIVLAVVDTVEKSLGGAFVRIGHTERAYLPLKDGKLAGSSKRPVVITKEAQGVKQAVVSDRLSIAGRYAVVTLGKGRWSFSAKLTNEEKETLREQIGTAPEGFDVLIRTNAREAAVEDILKEIREAVEELARISREAPDGKAYSVLYRPPEFYESLLRDLPEKPDRVMSDIPAVAERLAAICDSADYYEDRSLTLADRFDLKHEIEKLMQKVVWLKSGAYLVIEETEALTAIDVNSGHSKRGRSAEETYRTVNREAIAEAARQIRLREIGGMILIDLIKMKSDAERDELLKYAREELKKDRRHAEALDITKLGLLEIVRQKTSPPLAETLGKV